MAGIVIPKATGVEVKAEHNNAKFEAVIPFLQITYAPGLKAERQMELLWRDHQILREENSGLQKRLEAAKDKAADDLKNARERAATELSAAKNQLQAQQKTSEGEIAQLREQLCDKVRIIALTQERATEERILLATICATVLAFVLSSHSPIWPRFAPLMIAAWLSVAAWVYIRRFIHLARRTSPYRSEKFFAALQTSLSNISNRFQRLFGIFHTS